MTKLTKIITHLSIAATLLLASCSSKYGSRREAENAKRVFLEGGKEVLVIWTPTDEDYEEAKKDAQKQMENMCSEEKKNIMTIKPSLTTGSRRRNIKNRIAWGYSESAKVFIKRNCSPPIASVDRDALIRRDKQETRECFEEKVTNQFVCQEWRTNKTEMEWNEWISIKPNYSYFRY